MIALAGVTIHSKIYESATSLVYRGIRVQEEQAIVIVDVVNSPFSVERILVSGYAGIGRSALVQELYKPIAAKHGYFISGKFDQFVCNIPHSALVDALQN